MKFKARVLLTNQIAAHLELVEGLPNLQVGKVYKFTAEEILPEPPAEVAAEPATSVVTTENPWL